MKKVHLPRENTSDFIQLLKSRQQNAWIELYDLYAPAIYGILLKNLSREEAKNALEKTFVRLYEIINDYNSEKELIFTWIYRTMATVLEKIPLAFSAKYGQFSLHIGGTRVNGNARVSQHRS